MSKRNFTLLIIILVIILIVIFGFLIFNKPATNTTGGTTGTNFFSQFSPFGTKKTTTPPVVTPPVNVSGYQPPVTANIKLKKVSSMPIAGYTVFGEERLKATNPTPALPLSGAGASTVSVPLAKGGAGGLKTTAKTPAPLTELVSALRYVARATGNIYETFADNISEKQFSSTVIPKVYDAYFGNKGQSVAMRYLQADGKTIETFLGALPKEPLGGNTGAVNINGSLLPNDTKDVSVSPDSGSMFYLFDSGSDMVGTTVNLTTNKKVQIFDSPFTEWLSSWPNNKIITLTTKPASGIPGYMYEIDQSGKNFNEVLGNINGLTTEASPDGKLILYADDNLSLSIYNPTTNLSTLLGVKSLPEKCVWGSASDVIYCAVPKSINAGQYPDVWYQGEVSFSDSIWKIDAKTGLATGLLDPVTAPGGGEDIDGVKLMLDSSQNYLFFVNKKDSYLWEFNLK